MEHALFLNFHGNQKKYSLRWKIRIVKLELFRLE